jgi:hypothetical protein
MSPQKNCQLVQTKSFVDGPSMFNRSTTTSMCSMEILCVLHPKIFALTPALLSWFTSRSIYLWSRRRDTFSCLKMNHCDLNSGYAGLDGVFSTDRFHQKAHKIYRGKTALNCSVIWYTNTYYSMRCWNIDIDHEPRISVIMRV